MAHTWVYFLHLLYPIMNFMEHGKKLHQHEKELSYFLLRPDAIEDLDLDVIFVKPTCHHHDRLYSFHNDGSATGLTCCTWCLIILVTVG